ncbi:uncharacterized protein VTP21DRAFT_7000 [Calcarisporiella thermophila]|uniref:uncharacterized protein n=1 Tax=Calcarisporiella thermophila TaxID=911321 RepID=UPI003743D0E8
MINMYLLPKLIYSALFAAMGSTVYLAIFYKETLGLPSYMVGVVFAIAPFVSALACPVWTSLADRTGGHRSLMAMIALLAALSIFLLSLVPMAQNLFGWQGGERLLYTVALVTLANIGWSFFGIPLQSLTDSGVLKILDVDKELYGRQRLWGSVSCGLTQLYIGVLIEKTGDINVVFYAMLHALAAYVGLCCVTRFAPAPAAEMLEEKQPLLVSSPLHHRLHNYSSSSVKSTIDYLARMAGRRTGYYHSIPVMVEEEQQDEGMGEIVVCHDEQDEVCSLSATNSSTTLYTTCNASFKDDDISVEIPAPPPLPKSTLLSVQAEPYEIPAACPETVWDLVNDTRMILFLSNMLLMAMALSMINSFLFLFMRHSLHATGTQLGWTGPMSALTELLFFFYSKQLLSNFGGSFLILLAHVVTIVRALAYTILPPGPFGSTVALSLQLLNGVAFSGLWAAGVQRADEFAPPHLSATSQGLFAAVYLGIGTGLGSLVGGMVYETMGAVAMFLAVVGVVTGSLVIFLEANASLSLVHAANSLFSKFRSSEHTRF